MSIIKVERKEGWIFMAVFFELSSLGVFLP